MKELAAATKKVKRQSTMRILFSCLAIVLIFTALELLFPFRIDLTEEKRFSLHPATIEVLENLKNPLEVELLLTGDLPGGMRRFERSIEEMVLTFDDFAAVPISLHKVDPLSLEEETQAEFVQYIADFGINPTNLFASENGSQTSRLIFPGLLVRNEEYETGGLLLKGAGGMSPDEILNLSIENIEYELIRLIQRLEEDQKPAVAMITNHGEFQEDEGYGVVEALSEFAEVYKVPLQQAKSVQDLMTFDLIIVSSPREEYEEGELYLLDQYLMRGGRLLVALDPMAVDMEAAAGEGTVALPYQSGLENLLFKYGIRINPDLVQDMNYGYYPVVAGEFGDQPQIVPLPWPFYVIASEMAQHPMVKGLDQLQLRFVSSLDTVKAEGLTRTALVYSGQYSRLLSPPVPVAFREMSQEPDVNQFNRKHLPLAYLMEGKFTSLFQNRFLPAPFEKDTAFRDTGDAGAVVVVGDGDWLQGRLDVQTGEPMPLGKDPFSEETYGNREFLINAVNYLIDPDGIMATRNKVLKIRPLDQKEVLEDRTYWQLFNVVLPILIVLAFGGIKIIIRNYKYSRPRL